MYQKCAGVPLSKMSKCGSKLINARLNAMEVP